MNVTMITQEAWAELERNYPEASKFLYRESLKEGIRYNENRARLTNNPELEKEIVQKIFDLRERLNKE